MKKVLSIITFVLSLVTLLISLKLFWNMGVVQDEYNLSAATINGGEFWLSMDWLRLVLLFLLCVVSFVNILKSNKK